MKRILLGFLMLFAFNANASSIPEGAIIKTADNPDVYIVKYNAGKQYKRLVLNPLVFKSYGHLKWENLLTISDSEMNSFTTSDLVKVDGSNDIYELVPEGDNGGKYQLTSTDGYDLDSVYIINAVDFGNYSARGLKGAKTITPSNTTPDSENTVSEEDLKNIAETTAKTERLVKANTALEKLTPIVKQNNEEIAALYSRIKTKQAEIDAEEKSDAARFVIDRRVAELTNEYNKLVEEYNFLLEKRARLSTIIYEIDDYAKSGTLIPAADRAYMASLGINL